MTQAPGQNPEVERNGDRRQGDRRMGWLVSDWRKAGKWLSVQIPAAMTIIGLAYQGIEPFLPALKEYISPILMLWVLMAGAVASAIGRIKAQPVKEIK